MHQRTVAIMSDNEFQALLRFFKALGDESRLKIVGILAQDERSVDELATMLDLKEPTVSHHLAKLKEIGLVSMTPDGNRRRYRLEVGALHLLSKEILMEETVASVAASTAESAWDTKVLATFIEGDQITQVPRSYKKRMVIVSWLAGRFEPGARYPEKDVNEIIARHHPDYATFRREMVDARLMEREAGVYWLADNVEKVTS
jgi:DNA-binding transcriptional ArsR family regulator